MAFLSRRRRSLPPTPLRWCWFGRYLSSSCAWGRRQRRRMPVAGRQALKRPRENERKRRQSKELTMKLAFLGLGVMGYPMAGHLSRAGHAVTVFNRTPAKASKWTETYGGKSAPTPAAAARGAEIVLMCVGNDDD